MLKVNTSKNDHLVQHKNCTIKTDNMRYRTAHNHM